LIQRVRDQVETAVAAAAAMGVIHVATCVVAKHLVDAAISVIVCLVAALAIDDGNSTRSRLRRRQRGAPTGDTKGYCHP